MNYNCAGTFNTRGYKTLPYGVRVLVSKRPLCDFDYCNTEKRKCF